MSVQECKGDDTMHRRQFPSKLLGASLIGEEEKQEIDEVISDMSLFRHYGLGNPCKVNSIELDMAAFLGVKFALGVSSGSAALFCALAAVNVQPGDEVILPAFCWYSDYNSIVNLGAVPVFAEIDDSMCLSADDFKNKISARTKAVIIIHYQGAVGDLDSILRIAHEKGIIVIEDVAQAFGGEYKGRKFGSIGDIGLTSFQNNKVITCGEGGLVYTNSEEYFERAVRYHDLGFIRDVFAKRLENKILTQNTDRCFAGLQFRMNEMQGAVLRAQFKKLPCILESCRNTYNRIVEKLDIVPSVSLRPVHEGHCGISMFIRFENKKSADFVSIELEKVGIPVGPASSCCNILHNIHVRNGHLVNGRASVLNEDSCPETDDILSRYVGIGIGPLYTNQDADEISDAINNALKLCNVL